MRFPATPGWVLLPVVVGVPRHTWLRAPGAVPCHSWLGCTGGGGVWLLATPGCGPGCGSPPVLAGVRRPRRWPFPWGVVGGFSCCVCLWRGWCLCWCVLRVFLVVAWVWVCLPCVLVCVCVCACVVCGGWFPRLGPAAGVGVGVAGVCCGWSLATPGGGS